jgi:hypothetical protein
VFRFTYEAVSHGGVATVADGEREARLVLSDLEDPLAALAEATVGIARGAARATVDWTAEPRMYRWVLQRVDDGLSIEVLAMPRMDHLQTDDKGRPVFTATCRLVDFTGQVLGALRLILEEHGLEGYRTLSPHGNGFPVADYEALATLQRARRYPPAGRGS